MKKSIVILLSALTLLSFAACGTQTPAPTSSQEPSSSQEASEAASSEDASTPEPADTQRLVVSDASCYQGVISDFAVSDDGKTVLLMKPSADADGTEILKVKIDDSTRYSFDSTEMGNGAGLEIYYSGEPVDGMVTAIAINRIDETTAPVQESLIYDGELVEHTPDADKPGNGSILMKSFEGDNEYVFNYHPETKINVDLATLKAGDKLHIVHSIMATRSIPPQSPAFEISYYVAA